MSKVQEDRKRWRYQKQQWRAKISAQKKRRINEHETDMKRKRQFRREKRKAMLHIVALKSKLKESANTKHQLKLRAQTLNTLLKKTLSGNFYRTPVEKRRRRKIVASILPMFASLRQASFNLGLRLDYLRRLKAKHSIETKCEDAEKQSVQTFYLSDEVSTRIGGMKGVDRFGKNVVFLKNTLDVTFRFFREKYPSAKIGKSTFKKLRPNNCKLSHKIPKNMAACDTCENLVMLRKCAHAALKVEGLESNWTLLKQTLCPVPPKQDFHKRACIERKCEECPSYKELESKLLGICKNKLCDNLVWNKWENVKSKSDSSRKMQLVEKKGTTSELITALCHSVNLISEHLFNAQWQPKMFSKCASNVNKDYVLQVLDFSQNYLCVFQDEAQAAHWCHEQATIHPIVTYFPCSCGEIIREDSVIISNDLKHDVAAVRHFDGVVDEHLTKERGILLERKVQFTDGAAGQYKGKTAFASIAESKYDLTRHFFGTHHGKGPSDSAGGAVKGSAARAVKARRVCIRDAKDLYKYCSENLSIGRKVLSNECTGGHMRRSFFFVHSRDILRDQVSEDFVTVKGTRKLHSVTNILGKNSSIMTRNLACCCNNCQTGQREDCENSDHVDQYKAVSLVRAMKVESTVLNQSRRKREALSEETGQKSSISDDIDEASDPEYLPPLSKKRKIENRRTRRSPIKEVMQ